MKRKIALFTLLLMLIPNTAIAKTTRVPDGLGMIHTYTPWDKIKWGSGCKKLINYMEEKDAISNNYGIVTYGNYFAGALTSTYGTVGDMMLVVQNDNSVYPVIMADTKSQNDEGCNKWGHHYGKCIVEFEILSSYKKPLYKGSGGYISDNLAKPISYIINLGSVYEDELYLNNPEKACIDNGLEGYALMVNPYEYKTIEKGVENNEIWSCFGCSDGIFSISNIHKYFQYNLSFGLGELYS